MKRFIVRAIQRFLPALSNCLYRKALASRMQRAVRRGEIDIGVVAEFLKNAPGTHDLSCPVCGFVGRFRAFGSPPRFNSRCPACGALERHRHLALLLRDMPLQGSVLHFAPEDCVTRLLSQQPVTITTADLYSAGVDLVLNIEKIDLPDRQFDAIVCSHVLEHVDDRRAMPEMFRILKPGGLLIAMVPIAEGVPTYEDSAITGPAERERHFWQYDHVRIYGSDFPARLEAAGFRVHAHTVPREADLRHGIGFGSKIFLCRRPA